MATLGLRSCVARQEPYIPGALSILPGTVPGQVRGLGYMVPTYFRRELRDRVLQRPSRLRSFVLLVIARRQAAKPSSFVGWAKRSVPTTASPNTFWWARRKCVFAHPTVSSQVLPAMTAVIYFRTPCHPPRQKVISASPRSRGAMH